MIVRRIEDALGTQRDVRGETWRSVRLLLAEDGVGFSFHETTIDAGTTTRMQYLHHVEAVYCIAGEGRLRDLSTADEHPIEHGTFYTLDEHDPHELVADTTLRLVCVFRPALLGHEVHDGRGAYPAPPPDTTAVADVYATRGCHETPVLRREAVLHGGPDRPGPLSRDDLLAFARDGFLVLRGRFDTDEVACLRRAASEAGDEATSTETIREPEGDAVRSRFAFHRSAGPLGALAREARLVEPAKQILADDVYVHQSRLNRKPAFDGREFAWHSDFETWHAEDGMPGMRALSAVVMLDRNDGTNGAMMVIPGSHRVFVPCVGATPADHHETSLRRQVYGVPSRDALTSLARDAGVSLISGEPGDVLLFDANLLHASTGNLSPFGRANLFVVYNADANRPRVVRLRPRPAHVASDGRDAVVTPCRGLHG